MTKTKTKQPPYGEHTGAYGTRPAEEVSEGIDEAGLLDSIVDELDQCEWNADTLERIATKLRQAGYTIRDLKEDTNGED